EAKDFKRDMPFGIIASLIICTVLYILIALVLTGVASWKDVGTAEPMLTVLELAGNKGFVLNLARVFVGVGAVIRMPSVLLVFQLGQPRIFYSMARDGLLPPWAAKIHPKYKTPHVTTIVTGIFVGVFAAFAPIGIVLELTNIGTLFAFILVALGIIVLRRIDPDRPRPFRTPWVPLLPLVSIGFCGYLIYNLPWITQLRFVGWLALGAAIYFLYSVRHSKVRQRAGGRS